MEEIYKDGLYAERNMDWHISDADKKAKELILYIEYFSRNFQDEIIKVGDLGGGTGAVSNELLELAVRKLKLDITVIEISKYAIELGKQKFPNIKFLNSSIDQANVKFDLLLLIDVLEHVENPWKFLRHCSKISNCIIVRQPLLENFSTFRNQNYKHERERWGHINFFTKPSFDDLMLSAGYKKVETDLLPPWLLETDEKYLKHSIIKKLLYRTSPLLMSYFTSGFYYNGIFCLNE